MYIFIPKHNLRHEHQLKAPANKEGKQRTEINLQNEKKKKKIQCR